MHRRAKRRSQVKIMLLFFEDGDWIIVGTETCQSPCAGYPTQAEFRKGFRHPSALYS